MRLLAELAVLAAAFAGRALSAPIVATPGGAEDIIINADDTLNATTSTVPLRVLTSSSSTSGTLDLALVNNLASSNVHAYVSGLDSNGNLVMLQPDGSWYYPTASSSSSTPQEITTDVAIPLGAEGSTTTITLPGYISSGRIWFADGTLEFFTVEGASGASLVEPSAVNPSDPSAATNWGFVELTYTASSGIYVNISYVDFVGLPLGISLTASGVATQTAEGVDYDAVAEICADLKSQAAKDGQPWDQLCVTDSSGNYLRVLSPFDYMSINSSAFSTYWTSYINQVWTHYATTNLTIDTQAAAGLVNCTTKTGSFVCDGDNRSYAKPSASDIFGCNGGPFLIESGDNAVHYAVVPRLCAAFNRATLLLTGGNVQPSLSSSNFYTTSPTNWYSAAVHDLEVDGKGYSFAYDDVTPDGATNESGLLAATSPTLLTVTVGGPTC